MTVRSATMICFFTPLVSMILIVQVSSAEQNVDIATQLKRLAAAATEAQTAGRMVCPGSDGWLYFAPELRALSIGDFWGPAAAKVSRATKPQYADPLEAITDFASQLKRSSVHLLLVPVPAKIVIYPKPFLGTASNLNEPKPVRLDQSHQKFYELIQSRGADVIDLVPAFLEARDKETQPLYCQTDSHWSGRAVVVAAKVIGEHIRRAGWLKDFPTEQFSMQSKQVMIVGDLARSIDEANPLTENVAVTACGRRSGHQLANIEPSRTSPVLLMGDSHTLVFHDPTLFASGAGLPDHLAQELGLAVDLIGVRGSGSDTARIELMRRKDNLEGKKLVIWCFSFREFSESESGWRKIPVIRP